MPSNFGVRSETQSEKARARSARPHAPRCAVFTLITAMAARRNWLAFPTTHSKSVDGIG